MIYVYAFITQALYYAKLKKASVRLARFIDAHGKLFFTRFSVVGYLCQLTWVNDDFPHCDDPDFGCHEPILSDNDPYHESCRKLKAVHDAKIQAQDAEVEYQYWLEHADARRYDELMASFCTHADPHCFEEADPYTGKCTQHKVHDAEDIFDASDYGYDDRQDDEEDECQGICGQPAYACTCAETKSYRAFQADPATRGSWWTA